MASADNTLVGLLTVLALGSTIFLGHPASILFAGTLIKLQADWRPLNAAQGKDLARNLQSPIEKPGFWGVLGRTKRLEGWNGLMRGVYPYILNKTVSLGITVIVTFVLSTALKVAYAALLRTSLVPLLSASSVLLLDHVCFEIADMLVSLPLAVLSHRAVVHPSIPPWNPLAAFRAISTPSERRAPWRLLQNDLMLIHILLRAENLIVNRYVGLPWLDPSGGTAIPPHFDAARTARFVSWLVISILILAPFHNAFVRLAVQRGPMGPTSHETVIIVRPTGTRGTQSVSATPGAELEPYSGLLDCLQTMVAEEGPQSLLRGAPITLAADLFKVGRMFAYAMYLRP